jgi:hypothetical protein
MKHNYSLSVHKAKGFRYALTLAKPAAPFAGQVKTNLQRYFRAAHPGRVGLLLAWMIALNLLIPVLLPATQNQASAAVPQEYPVAPYISQDYLNALPWGKQSFYIQPWRAYMETVPATQLQDGIGINYNMPEDTNNDAAVALLARAGFKHMRLEMSWTKVNWDENGLIDGNTARYMSILTAFHKYGITPLILLNANDGMPGPNLAYNRKVMAGGTAGSTTLTLDSVANLVPKYSGISNLTTNKMNEVFFTRVNSVNKTVTLSKPLPRDLAPGTMVQINTLKYQPFYPVGTPEFNQTMAGWLKYTKLMLDMVKQAGIDNFEVEIWNEFTFGSDFLSINNYYSPQIANFPPFFQPGGQAWEMGNQTLNFVKQNYPGTKVIWGFSNTSFYETEIKDLPAGMDGQSYHPYGTDKKVSSPTFPEADRYSWFVEGFVPQNVTKSQPEGWAQDGIKTETLTHLLNPTERLTAKPANTTTFSHYFSEHGSIPSENGITDPADALAFKQKSLVRSLLFWLNKGISKVDIFSAYEDSELAQGMLYAGINPADYASYSDDQLLTPALKTLQNTMAVFAGAISSPQTRPLSVDVTSLGNQTSAFKGDATHPDLYNRDLFTFLPYQVNPQKFVIATYVMSYDITKPLEPMDFRQTIKNVNGLTANVKYYDPITNQAVPVNVVSREANSITVVTQNVDYPRLLTVDENPTTAPDQTTRGPLSVRSTVQITAPANNAQVTRNSVVTLKAAASDPNGVSKVEFYVNNSLKCTVNNPAYTCDWRVADQPNTRYTIKVVAYNTKGNTQTTSIRVTTR